MNPIRSLEARLIQPWQQRHFEKTKAGKKLAALKDRHRGERCFLIGNGPSLRAEDLTMLHERGEITFAFNRIFNIFEQTLWRPTYYVSQDEKMLGGCVDEVNAMELSHKFVPIQLKWYHGIDIRNALYFNIDYQSNDDVMQFTFSDDIDHSIACASTCMYSAAQLACYMGFTEIYLIGVDHHFHTSINNHGEIVVDETAKDYFSDAYNPDKANLFIPNTEKSTLTYVAMKKQCDLRGVKIYNATRGGKLEVFERVDFDNLFTEEEV